MSLKLIPVDSVMREVAAPVKDGFFLVADAKGTRIGKVWLSGATWHSLIPTLQWLRARTRSPSAWHVIQDSILQLSVPAAITSGASSGRAREDS